MVDTVGERSTDPDELADDPQIVALIDRLADELEQTPNPDTEWLAVRDVLGGDLLTDLVGASNSSIRRYLSGDRPTPDGVAARLHFLAMRNADLLGAYNDWGVRRWYGRRRTALDGRRPADILTGDWDLDAHDVRAVAQLARSLVGSSAT